MDDLKVIKMEILRTIDNDVLEQNQAHHDVLKRNS
jgi:hypothetical protein